MPKSTTERGFFGYADFDTTYGHRMMVYESSAASAPHVWVSTGPVPRATEGATAHLNVEQARLLRDALTEWLDEIPTRWRDGEKFLTPEPTDPRLCAKCGVALSLIQHDEGCTPEPTDSETGAHRG